MSIETPQSGSASRNTGTRRMSPTIAAMAATRIRIRFISKQSVDVCLQMLSPPYWRAILGTRGRVAAKYSMHSRIELPRKGNRGSNQYPHLLLLGRHTEVHRLQRAESFVVPRKSRHILPDESANPFFQRRQR